MSAWRLRARPRNVLTVSRVDILPRVRSSEHVVDLFAVIVRALGVLALDGILERTGPACEVIVAVAAAASARWKRFAGRDLSSLTRLRGRAGWRSTGRRSWVLVDDLHRRWMDEASQRPRSHSEAFRCASSADQDDSKALTGSCACRTLFAPLRAVGSRSPSPAPTSHGDNDAGVLDDEAALVLADPGPSVQGQGFSIYLASLVAYLAFLLWSLCPDRWLVAMGIEWYPNRCVDYQCRSLCLTLKRASREWAVLVPAWSVMLVAFTYITYALVNVAVTPYRKILGESCICTACPNMAEWA